MSTLSLGQHDRYLEVLEAAKSLCNGDLDASMRWVSHTLKALDGKASASMVAIRSDLELALLPTMLSRARAWRTSRVRINAQAVSTALATGTLKLTQGDARALLLTL